MKNLTKFIKIDIKRKSLFINNIFTSLKYLLLSLTFILSTHVNADIKKLEGQLPYYTSISAVYKTPGEFDNLKDWFSWLDENDTNVGVLDKIYDAKFLPHIVMHNDLIIIGGGGLKNLSPIRFYKSIYLNGISIDTVHDYWSNKHKYGVAFWSMAISNDITVDIKNVTNSFSNKLIRIENDNLKVTVTIKNVTIINNSSGGIHIRAIVNNAIIEGLSVTEPIGYEYAMLEASDVNQKNAGNAYIDQRTVYNDTTLVRYYSSGLTIGSKVNYSENIQVKNCHFENIIIGKDATSFQNGGNTSRHTTALMIAGNNCKITNTTFKNCERSFYLRGNNFTVDGITVENNKYVAGYMYIHKGQRHNGITKITNSEFKGKTKIIALHSSTDSTVIKNVKFEITPTNITYKLDDDFITRQVYKGFLNEGIFREKGGNFTFEDVKTEIKANENNLNFTYLIGLTGSGNNSLFFNNVNYIGTEPKYFLAANKFKKIELNNVGIFGKTISINNTKKLNIKNIYPALKGCDTYLFNIYYITNVDMFTFNNEIIEVIPGVLNRIRL